jgi:hypothetical protein
LASSTICLQASRFIALSFHLLTPIFLRSMETLSSHLILGLPLRLVAYNFPYSIFGGGGGDCGVFYSFNMPKPSYSLAFDNQKILQNINKRKEPPCDFQSHHSVPIYVTAAPINSSNSKLHCIISQHAGLYSFLWCRAGGQPRVTCPRPLVPYTVVATTLHTRRPDHIPCRVVDGPIQHSNLFFPRLVSVNV